MDPRNTGFHVRILRQVQAVQQLGEGQRGPIGRQLLVVSAVQNAHLCLTLYHQTAAYPPAFLHPGGGLLHQYVLRRRALRHGLLSEGKFPFFHRRQQLQLRLLPPHPQGRVLSDAAAQPLPPVGIAGHGEFRHHTQIQLPGRDGPGLGQQQPPGNAHGGAAHEPFILHLAGKRHLHGQAPQARALLRGVQHRQHHAAAYGELLTGQVLFPQPQLTHRVHDPGHIRAVFRDSGLHGLLLGSHQVAYRLTAGDFRKFQLQFHAFPVLSLFSLSQGYAGERRVIPGCRTSAAAGPADTGALSRSRSSWLLPPVL